MKKVMLMTVLAVALSATSGCKLCQRLFCCGPPACPPTVTACPAPACDPCMNGQIPMGAQIIETTP